MHSCFLCFSCDELCCVSCQFAECESCFWSVRKCDLVSDNKRMDKVISEAEKLSDKILQTCICLTQLKAQQKFWLGCLKSLENQKSQNILKIKEDKIEVFISFCITQEFTSLSDLPLDDFSFFSSSVDETVAEGDSSSLDSPVIFKYFCFLSNLFIWSSIVDFSALESPLPQICLSLASDSEMCVVLMFLSWSVLTRILEILSVFWCQMVNPICSLLIPWLP